MTFAVTAGGGTVVGSPATTNANGVATITSWTLGTGAWTLGPTAGAHTLTVTAAGGPAVVIHATALPGTPATAMKVGGDNSSALANQVVEPLAVMVEDAYGNPVVEQFVNFRVTQGGGYVGGAREVTVATDGTGVARTGGYRLGGIGPNEVVATVADLPPLVFTATALDPCVVLTTALTIGSVVNANISPGDCLDSEYFRRSDRYTLTFAGPQEFELTINSTELLAGFRLDGAGREILASWMSEPGTPAGGRFSLPAGTYAFRALQSPWVPSQFGAYTLTTTAGLPNDCGTTHTVRGITVSGSLAPDDCISETTGRHYSDRYAVYLHPGDQLTVNVQAEGSWITEIRTTGLIATSGEPRTNPGATITATEAGYHFVVLINATNDLATGAYTLTIAQ